MKIMANTIQTKNLTQISYFEVIKKTNKFKRVVASLVELKPHTMKIRIQGTEYVIQSAYDLTKLRMGSLLLAFVYPNKKGVSRLYPLPKGARFSEEHVKEKFNFTSEEEKKNKIHEHSQVNEKTKELMKLKNQITTAWRQLMNYAAPLVNSNEDQDSTNQNVNITVKHKGSFRRKKLPSNMNTAKKSSRKRSEVPIYSKKKKKYKKKAAKFFKSS